MSNIVALGFEGQETAKGWLNDLEKLAEDGHIDIMDAVVVSRGVSDNVDMKQTKTMTKKYAGRGTGIGFLAGLLLGGPILGAAGGAAVGAITGSMKDVGIDDHFCVALSSIPFLWHHHIGLFRYYVGLGRGLYFAVVLWAALVPGLGPG